MQREQLNSFFLALCQERVDPTQLDDFKLSQRLLETYPNLSVNICHQSKNVRLIFSPDSISV